MVRFGPDWASSALSFVRKIINMAKAAKTAIKKDPKANLDAKNYTKVVKTVRSPKSGAYTFKEVIIHKDKVQDFFNAK